MGEGMEWDETYSVEALYWPEHHWAERSRRRRDGKNIVAVGKGGMMRIVYRLWENY